MRKLQEGLVLTCQEFARHRAAASVMSAERFTLPFVLSPIYTRTIQMFYNNQYNNQRGRPI